MRKGKVTAAILAAVMCLLLPACGGQMEQPESEAESSTAPAAVVEVSTAMDGDMTTQNAIEETSEQASKASGEERRDRGESGGKDSSDDKKGGSQGSNSGSSTSNALEVLMNAAPLHPQKPETRRWISW